MLMYVFVTDQLNLCSEYWERKDTECFIRYANFDFEIPLGERL